jgi:hypothetical protein
LNSSDPDQLESDGQWNQKLFNELTSYSLLFFCLPGLVKECRMVSKEDEGTRGIKWWRDVGIEG